MTVATLVRLRQCDKEKGRLPILGNRPFILGNGVTTNPVSLYLLAEWTGLEPATPGVTGRYSNQLNYHSALKLEGVALRNPLKAGVPTGIRTPVHTVKGYCPRPLDDRDIFLVEVRGIEPRTSCMPCKRSPS